MGNFHEINIVSASFERGASGSGGVERKTVLGKWEVDPQDETSVQFRIPSESLGLTNDRIGFYISGSGKIGIGTKDPETAFDIRDAAEDKEDKEGDRKEVLFKVDRTEGNIDVKATTLKSARTIGGVSFDGSSNINLPGVNIRGNQDTTGNADTAISASYASTGSVLSTARTIGGVSFDGSANINLPGVNGTGNQNTSGTAAGLTTSRKIGNVSFDGTSDIVPSGHKGSITTLNFLGTDFATQGYSNSGIVYLRPNILVSPTAVIASAAGSYYYNVTIPVGLELGNIVVYGDDTKGCVFKVYASYIPNALYGNLKNKFVQIDGTKSGAGTAIGTTLAGSDITAAIKAAGITWSSTTFALTIEVVTDGTDTIFGGTITMA
jgi:hypothetical protein